MIGSALFTLSALALPVTLPAKLPAAKQLVDVVGKDARLVVTLTGGQTGLDQLRTSEILARVRMLPGFEQAMKHDGIREARTALRFIAGILGKTEWEAAGALLGRETVVGLREPTVADGGPDILAIVRAESQEIASQLDELLYQVMILAGGDGNPSDDDGVRSANGELFTARQGDCMVLSNSEPWIRKTLGFRSRPAPTPADGAVLHARLDLAGLRSLGLVDNVPERHDNALAPLLFQGMLHTFQQGDGMEADLSIDRSGVRGSIAIEGQSSDPGAAWVDPPGSNVLTPPADATAFLRLRRDYSAFYEERFELLRPDLEGDILEFENVLSLFFGGRSFGDELLPALGDDALIVLSEPKFPDLITPPMIQIPAFALITPFDTERLRPDDLIVAFQTVIGVVNADRAQNGEAPLMIRTETRDGVTIAMANYLAPMDGEGRPEMRYNAAPAIAIVSGKLVLSSSAPQLRDLITHLSDPQAPADGAGTALSIDLARAAAMLARNREPLVANRVVEEGESPDEAGAMVDYFVGILGELGVLDASLAQGDGSARLRFSILSDRQAREEG